MTADEIVQIEVEWKNVNFLWICTIQLYVQLYIQYSCIMYMYIYTCDLTFHFKVFKTICTQNILGVDNNITMLFINYQGVCLLNSISSFVFVEN